MSHTVPVMRARRATIIVPAHEVEPHLMMGWRLVDEPCCSGAYMLPPDLQYLNRVPNNSDCALPGKEKARLEVASRSGQKTIQHGFDIELRRAAQE